MGSCVCVCKLVQRGRENAGKDGGSGSRNIVDLGQVTQLGWFQIEVCFAVLEMKNKSEQCGKSPPNVWTGRICRRYQPRTQRDKSVHGCTCDNHFKAFRDSGICLLPQQMGVIVRDQATGVVIGDREKSASTCSEFSAVQRQLKVDLHE